jgi:hypothetical protein
MNRAITILVAVFCLWWSASAQTAIPYSYQSNVLGVITFQEFTAKLKPDDLQSWHSSFGCFDALNGTRSCVSRSSFETTYRFVDDKLASVMFAFNDGMYLSGYIEGLTEKFGAPAKTTTTYQNGFGASFTGNVWTWENSFGGIVLEEFGENREAGTLYYYDTKLAAEFKSRAKVKPLL